MVSDMLEGCKFVRVDMLEEKFFGVWIWEYVLKYILDVSFIRELIEFLFFFKDVVCLK